MIRFESVTYSYPQSDVPALDSVDLALESGEFLAVVGANGSGKSTLALLCDGLLLPTQGRVEVDGMDTSDAATTWDVRMRVGLVFQNPDNQIVGSFVEEDVAFGPENAGIPREEIRERVDAALAAVGLTALAAREPHLLSEGQKQRLALAGALALDPAYLVLDEPTAMLDTSGRRSAAEIMASMAAEGRGVLHITHDLADIGLADRVIALDCGRVAFEGSPAELLDDEERLERLGLERPALSRLSAELRARGRDVPLDVRDAESLMEAL